MIELKPSAEVLAMALNLSPINSSNEKAKFATDFCGKFDGEPFKAAAENVKFKRETTAKTPALPQIKFDPNARKFYSFGSSEAGVKFSFKFNPKALK